MIEEASEKVEDGAILQREIARRSREGWQVVTQTPNYAQMRQSKRFSFAWFLFWLVVSFGFLFWLYPVYHWSKRDKIIFLQLQNGQLLVDDRVVKPGYEGVVGEVIVACFTLAGNYWHWAKGQGIVVRILSILVPVIILIGCLWRLLSALS